MRVYEQELDRHADWALREGSMHFDEKSAVHDALREIVRRLRSLQIPFAIVGGMALFHHGLRRFTEDVNVLLTADGLRQAREGLEGLGYLAPFPGSRQLRDTQNGVRIEFLVSGQYPGDGKPKPVAFPDPAGKIIEINGIPLLQLPALIELKLASGLSNPGRLKDLADVQELIRVLKLPGDFADRLNPYVRAKYQELWNGVYNVEENQGQEGPAD